MRKRFSYGGSNIITIREVARKAGVSVSTVSHVVNGTRFVSDDLKSRVLSSMEELDYQPNRIARSLRRRRTNSIGLIITNITNPFFSEIAWTIEYLSFLEKYSLFLCCTNGKREKETFYINELSEWQVDGIILISPRINPSYLKLLEDRNIPVVLIDIESSEGNYDLIKIDNIMGGKMATDHLISLGHKKIACISGPNTVNVSRNRVEGYKESLREHGLPVDEKYIIEGNFDLASGVECANTIFEMDERPTAIFACDDQLAIGVIQSAAAHDLKVPDDISVIGFDDIKFSKYTVPPLTTIRQPLHDIGEQALKCMLERIADPNKNSRVIKLNLRLIERKSTAKINQKEII